MSSETAPRSGNVLVGKIVVLLLFLFSVLAVAAAYWYHSSMIAKASELWQPPGERCLRYSEDIHAWRLQPAPASGDVDEADLLKINGKTYQIVERKKVALEGRIAALAERQQFDLSYLRRALLYDTSYEWELNPTSCKPKWNYAVQFHYEGETATAIFSLDCPRLHEPKRGQTVVLTEPAIKLFGQFFERGVFAPPEERNEAAEEN